MIYFFFDIIKQLLMLLTEIPVSLLRMTCSRCGGSMGGDLNFSSCFGTYASWWYGPGGELERSNEERRGCSSSQTFEPGLHSKKRDVDFFLQVFYYVSTHLTCPSISANPPLEHQIPQSPFSSPGWCCWLCRAGWLQPAVRKKKTHETVKLTTAAEMCKWTWKI